MKRSKLLVLLLVVVMTTSIFTGCSNKETNNVSEEVEQEESAITESYGIKIDENTVTFIDARDKEVTFDKNPERVVCLFNSFLDIWYKCGGTVIGKVDEAKEKPIEGSENAEAVGGPGSPSVEKIISLNPDLVIISSNFTKQLEVADILEQNNIKVLALDNEYKEDYFKTVRLFTALTDREDLYEKYEGEVRASIDSVISKVPKDKNYKVLVIFATAKGITVRSSESMVGEMLKDLNTINISDTESTTSDSRTFSMEKIIEEDPDFIFVQTMGSDKEKINERLKSDVESNPAWSSLKAVKDDRYIILPKDLYLYKPNDRYGEAYEGLAKILYPEVFN
ncbi:ABC transporter substrate-binding protein [Tissierella sp. MSJ-40]|uniref:ABC transporter substrate-binding protein n=1 Tax=Tissierella simiarum TaxID=2841534 RepID=A0ABS6EBL6_9FIRM|nr:ABC transporter substrate-binding protein [Tissierella simiarum]MBU5440332.1 ABC transporter substrate-binding protein [Tissierella simiarum]